ncbi:glycosyltransferase [Acidimicrobiia bacterium]|nr:glycosyltransferase [Acidimicrobiia bacterium]
MKKEKILILNISTDSNNTSLGFAVNWINQLSEYYIEIDVVTLNKGATHMLNNNVNVYSHDSINKITKFIEIRKTIKNLLKNNEYRFCLSHMTTSLTLVSSTIFRFKNLQSILWYTHKGPTTFIKKIVLYLGALFSDRIITASESSFPLKFKKVTSIGHAINYENFYRSRINTESKDFLILSRISRSKNIDESIQGFLNSVYGEIQSITIVGGPLTKQDTEYESYLKNKYSKYPNIRFTGSIPHPNLNTYIDKTGFHINNTPKGFYDKSVLETLSGGIINFYMNSEYDKNIHPEYLNILKFDGTKDALTKSINIISKLEKDLLLEIIQFSQEKVKDESLKTLHHRILKVI